MRSQFRYRGINEEQTSAPRKAYSSPPEPRDEAEIKRNPELHIPWDQYLRVGPDLNPKVTSIHERALTSFTPPLSTAPVLREQVINMAETSRLLMVWPLLLATVLPMLYANFFPLLNQYAGRVAVVNPGSRYVDHGPKNNGKCKVFPGQWVA